MTQFVQAVVDGCGSGGVYALMALAFVITFRACGVINLALAEMGMVGAYSTAALLDASFHPVLAIGAGLVVAAAVGTLCYVTALRRVVASDHLVAVLITLGLGLALRSVIAVAFGTQERAMRTAIADGTWFVGDVLIWRLHVVTIAVAVVAVVATGAFMSWTRAGRASRALTEDLPVARLMGIRAPRAFGFAFAISAALAGLAVILSAHAGFLSLGTAHLGIRALPAVVLGGFDSVKGALVGGLAIGVSEQLVATYAAGDLAELMPFVLLLVVLVARPSGLFGVMRLRRV